MSRITITLSLDVSEIWGLEDLLDDLKSASNKELGSAILRILVEDLELFSNDLEWSVKISDPETEEEKNVESKTKNH